MQSQYLMQILHRETGEVVQFAPGEAVELDFVDACVRGVMEILKSTPQTAPDHFVERCTDAVVKRGVGLFTTEAHVKQDIQDGLNETLVQNGLETHLQEAFLALEPRIARVIEDTIYTLKLKVRP